MFAALPFLAVLLATPLTASVQIAAAQPGDTVKLASGAYLGVLRITGKTGITIDARGPAGAPDSGGTPLFLTPAVLDGIVIKGGADVTLLGGEYWPKTSTAILVRDAARIHLKNVSTFDSGHWPAISFTDSTDVSVEGARLDRPTVGIGFQRVTGFTARGNVILGAAIDGMDIAASHDGLVEFTGCMGNLLINLQHPDCIQMWTTAGLPITSNITVRYTMAYGNMQGVSAFDHGAGGFIGLVFEDNMVEGLQPDGISMMAAVNSAARRNTVRTLPGARFPVHIGLNPGVTHCGNTAAPANGKPGWSDGNC